MLVIFDVDGTLTRTSALNGRALARAFEETLQTPMPSRDWADYPRVSATGLLEDAAQRALDRPPTEPERAAVRARYVELVATTLFSMKERLEVPGAVQALDRLRAAGHAVALATGDWRESAQIKLERDGFDVDDVPLAAADDALAREDIIRAAYQASGGADVHPHVVYVGDEVWDLSAARSLGLAIVGLSADGQDARLREAGVQDILRDFEDFYLFESHLMHALARR